MTEPLSGLTWASEAPAGAAQPRRRDDASDWDLLARARSQASAFGVLFERHRDYVFRLAWGFCGEHAADDVTQEVFTRVLARRRPFLRRARFTTLLYQITLNVAREFRRRDRREGALDELDEKTRARFEQAQTAAPVEAELADLGKALATLSPRQREVIVLRRLEGLSTRETAAVLRCREGTVKVHLHRALRALRAALNETPRVAAPAGAAEPAASSRPPAPPSIDP